MILLYVIIISGHLSIRIRFCLFQPVAIMKAILPYGSLIGRQHFERSSKLVLMTWKVCMEILVGIWVYFWDILY